MNLTVHEAYLVIYILRILRYAIRYETLNYFINKFQTRSNKSFELNIRCEF